MTQTVYKKITPIYLGLILGTFLLSGCTVPEVDRHSEKLQSINPDIMNTSEQQVGVIFPLGFKAPNETFTGDVHVNMLVTDQDGTYNTQAYNVEFQPGARTYWHSHPGGQLLFVTEGVGYYQEEGKLARRLEKGDVVEIPINTKHWHGAAPDSHFTHLGITSKVDAGPAEWLGEVTEEEYSKI